MLRRLAFLLALVMVTFLGSSNAQWKYAKLFPNNTFDPTPISGSGINNGITVDPMGRIWVNSYRYADSIQTSAGTYIPTECLYCFNPDGTPASFSPIKVLKSKDGSIADTLNYPSMAGSYNYGMASGPDGSIYDISCSVYIFKIDYHDGSLLAQIQNPIPGYTSSLATPMVDASDEVFVTTVLPTSGVGPVAVSGGDLSSVLISVDTSMYGAYSRNVSVTSDGNDVWVHRIKLGSLHYHSNNGTLGPYVLDTNTAFKDLVIESSAWQPNTGLLWVSSGNVTSGMPNPPYRGYAWYGFDMTDRSNPVLKDSILWNEDTGVPGDSIKNDPRPRGIAFSPTGDTAYVGAFNVSGPGAIQMFTFAGSNAINELPPSVPTQYSLSQNYPNPFNPTTKIDYTLKAASKVTLAVYDVLGREVATLVNVYQPAGLHSVSFDASRLSSGIYIYTLKTSNGITITKKMVLMK